ncbi:MAG: hypothetical protein AAF433_17080 [Bacteroidota bacterium]
MKPIFFFGLIVYLMFGTAQALQALNSEDLLIVTNDECEDLEEAIVEVEEDIEDLVSSSNDEPSELEAVESAYTEAQEELTAMDEAAEQARENGSTDHGADYVRQRREAEQELENARIAYGELLATIHALYLRKVELLRQYREECAERFAEVGGAADLNDTEEKEEEYDETLDDLAGEQASDTEEDLGLNPERQPGESDEEYEERLEEERKALPWSPPTREAGESHDRFRRRLARWKRNFERSKWAKGFWKRVADGIDERYRNAASAVDPDLPEEESALPPDRQREYVSSRFRFALELERTNIDFFQLSGPSELERILYSDPQRYMELLESVGGEFLAFDFSNLDRLEPTSPHYGLLYGLVVGKAIAPQFEANLRMQYGRRTATQEFPMSLFFADGDTQSLMGKWTANRHSLRLSGGMEYRFGDGNLQLLLGPRVGLEQVSGKDEITIGSTTWSEQVPTERQAFYGLSLGLRQALGGWGYSELRASLERQAASTNFLIGLRFGLGQ